MSRAQSPSPPAARLHERPTGADLPDDPRNLLDAARTGVDVCAPQLGRQQMPAAEHVQRQIAVAVVIALEKAPLLMPVQRITGGVQIEDDPLRRLLGASRNSLTGSASIAAGLAALPPGAGSSAQASGIRVHKPGDCLTYCDLGGNVQLVAR